MKNISWWDVYSCEDPQNATEVFTSKLTNILDRMAPVKTFQVHVKYAAWLSDDTKKLIGDRDHAQAVAAETQHPDDWRLYRNLRNTVNARKKSEKKSLGTDET